VIRTTEFKEQQGYLTIAQNNSTTDYLKLAYLQALSIKATQKINSFAVMVDSKTKAQMPEYYNQVFDYVLDIPFEDDASSDEWKMANEWKVWSVTPYKETIKLESDLIIPVSIDHWWPLLRNKDVVFSTKVRDFRGNISNNNRYRHLFEINQLPMAYNGFSYFRYTRKSMDFFSCVRSVFENWDFYKSSVLRKCNDPQATTDVAYAIASIIVGEENCVLPHTDYPCMTHMKAGIQGWEEGVSWLNALPFTVDDDLILTVGGYRQQYPFHYYEKEFATTDIINKYEHRVLGRSYTE